MRVAIVTLCSLYLVSCDALSYDALDLPLSWSNSPDLKYRDTVVKVCGFATNQFENTQITEHRDDDWRGNAAGLGVNWLDREPYTEAPEQRCVTGLLEPTCGWDTFDTDEYEDLLCLSTGYSYEWRINQTTLARD